MIRDTFRELQNEHRLLQIFSYRFVKRTVDILGAFTLLVFFSPLMILTAIAIALTSKGPVIYRQDRVTYGGIRFTIYKFRTMTTDAEKGTGAVFAEAADPRVTPIGRFLRKTRIDELPQLFNVFNGEMSLIGPRPERPEMVPKLTRLTNFHQRMQVKAGLTGLAQVKCGYAACEESYREKIYWDSQYVKNFSFWQDLKIAMLTVIVILKGSGAR